MPISVSDFSWEQSNAAVLLSVPLRGVRPGSVDIIASDEYIKVSFPPYLLELLLFAPVDEARSSARLGRGVALLTLPKKEPAPWPQLMSSLQADKAAMRRAHEEALARAQEKARAEAEARAVRKREEEKFALQTMMQIEEDKRKRIEEEKERERQHATAELERWKEQQGRQEMEERRRVQEEEEKRRRREECARLRQQNREKQQQLPTAGGGRPPKKEKELPPPRQAAAIGVHFSPRVFPTALRESRVPEEEQWLKRQAEARNICDLNDPELSGEEKDPQWLKEKGGKLFAAGNYLAAVNAYDLAIRLSGGDPALHLNRAACHLKLRNLHKALHDSSRALELLTPPVPANRAARVKAHVRRGTALCQLEMFVEGLMDYEAALKLDPDNVVLREDARKIRDIVQGSRGEETR
ncbi:dynein axonemal assembly factor 4-like isoform X1 [Lethenteron reissneri]|uniref:dynein axonemal assembly factor 4-like isoform X1 n=1 Tax=Lethenteron reissneri TaxID=7753 RepID=UPI002AB66B90|nr:dynein axonemal assembly factor 4-like isoform X1 [Lethenteron reissneri]XP_061428594.1 dynein axonemal assembly factor 4-like isoform X1 [Lethenteron reissneri]